MARPTLLLLHAFGLSARSWDGVVAALGDRVDAVALDLPGSGTAAGAPGTTLEEAAEAVAAELRRREPDSWLVAGHGMGGRVAAIVAAWGERAEHGLIPPAGLALVGAAPPSPDPTPAERRAALRARWADGPLSQEDAEAVLDAGLVGPIPGAVRAAAVEDLRRTGRDAALAWLDRGALEDRSDAVGVLRTPAVIVVGEQDHDLGAAVQERLMLPHVPGAPVHVLDGAAHHVVLERPREVAARLAALVEETRDRPALPPAFARLIASDRVSARTRRVLMARLDEPGEDAPRALSPAQRELLAAVLDRVVPQRGTRIDLAARLDADLATGGSDGWRFAELPPDAEAWRLALDTLDAAEPGFLALDAAGRDAVLDRLAAGGIAGALTGAQLALWFRDVEAAAIRAWVSHPAAQAWIRYDGFADGGDGPRKQGFTTTHAGEWEPWQRDWRTGKELQA